MEDNCSLSLDSHSLHRIYFALLLAINTPSNDADYIAIKLFGSGSGVDRTFTYREYYKKSLSKENKIKVALNEKFN